MYKSTVTVLALLGAAVADDVTTNLFLVGFTSQSIVGSIITSDATATTYSLQCGDPNDCGAGLGGLPTNGLTFVQGASTVHYSYVDEETDVTETVELGCTITSSLTGTCSGSGIASVAGATTTVYASTSTFTDGGSAFGGQDVTLTGGALPTNSAAPSTTVSSQSSSGTKASTTKGKTSSTSSGASAASPTGNSTTSSSKAAAPAITQAPWMLGAAAAFAYAAM